MNALMDKKYDKVRIRAEHEADEGKKHPEKVELKTHDVDAVQYVERKLVDKGVDRMDAIPPMGFPLKHDPKKGTVEGTRGGPCKEFEEELVAEPAVDEKDPNYPEEEDEMVVGDVEVAKVTEEGVARVEVDHPT